MTVLENAPGPPADIAHDPWDIGQYEGMEAKQGSEVDMHGERAELRDDQQVRLLRSLQAARGAPVDFEDLRAMGIEHPAVLCYELEIAGVPIVQTRRLNRRMLALDPRAAQHAQVDLDDVGEAAAEDPHGAAQAPGWRGAAAAALRRSARRALATVAAGLPLLERARPALAARFTHAVGRLARPHDAAAGARTAMHSLRRRAGELGTARTARRAVAVAALAIVIAVIAAMAVAVSRHGAPPAPVGASARSDAGRSHAARPGGGAARPPRPAAPPPRQPIPAVDQLTSSAGAGPAQISPAAASALGLEGHQLLADGHYSAAIADLLGAIRQSGQSAARCGEPTTEACLTFAYSLYDLGRALRLSGNANAAVSILNERLRIDNQRPVVQHELELARGASA